MLQQNSSGVITINSKLGNKITRIEKYLSLNNYLTVNYGLLHLFLNDIGIKAKLYFMLFKIRKL
jgi:hypothetical protein